MAETTKELSAGRELDALVAEKVMGWEYHDEDGTWRREGRLICLEEHLDETLPDYSESIAAAWEVLGTLHGNVERWERFDRALREDVLPSMHATALHELVPDRAAEAICLAAVSSLTGGEE